MCVCELLHRLVFTILFPDFKERRTYRSRTRRNSYFSCHGSFTSFLSFSVPYPSHLSMWLAFFVYLALAHQQKQNVIQNPTCPSDKKRFYSTSAAILHLRCLGTFFVNEIFLHPFHLTDYILSYFVSQRKVIWE